MVVNRRLDNISEEFDTIHHALENQWNWSRLVIKKSRDFEATSSFTFWDLLPTWLLKCFAPDWYRMENRSTLHYFKDVFGRERLVKGLNQFGMDLDEKEREGMPITRREISLLFLSIGNLHVDDVTSLFQFIVADDPLREGGILEREARQDFHDSLKRKTIETLGVNEYRQLHDFLVPMRKIETLFLDHVPSFEKVVCDTEFEEFRRGVYLTEKIWREGAGLDEAVWGAWMAKSLVQRQQGTTNMLIPHPRGVYRLFGDYDTPTADVSFMQALTPGLPSMVKFYGMGLALTRSGLMAIQEGLLDPLGRKGMERIESAMSNILGETREKPYQFDARYSGIQEEEFIRSEEEELLALGYSMGCSVAMQLVMKNPGLFNHLILVSSPGIEEGQSREFAKRTDDGDMVIIHVVDERDVITQMGPSLGAWCLPESGKDVRLVVLSERELTSEELEEAILHPEPAPGNWFLRVIEFFKSFTGPHWTDTTLVNGGRYTMGSWDNTTGKGQMIINKVLGEESWEEVREELQTLV